MRLLIVDDQIAARRTLARCLSRLEGVEMHEAANLPSARQMLSQHRIDVALIDLRLDEWDPTNRDGLTLVRELRDAGSAVPIVVTVSSEMSEIRNAMRSGAYTYILKDELCEELVLPVLGELQSRHALEREVLHLHGLVGTSPPMERLRQQIKKVAAVDAAALALGPTGSGKELVARAIHALSPRREQPLVAINCGAFTESLVESQLFGHEKGYFTGADKARDGYLAEVRRGTLLLDEIAELPQGLQSKLLRVLENRVYRVLGGSSDSRFEGRILAATHVDLASRVADSRFRVDLYYRLEVLTVQVPSLDERKEDIPALVEHFAQESSRRLRFSDEALTALTLLEWPGNVRQLRNLIHRLMVFVEKDPIREADVERYRTAVRSGEDLRRSSELKKGTRMIGDKLLHGVSPRRTRKENALHLAQNQIRILEAEGASQDDICAIMGIARATLFRIKGGQE